jgi:hypothetical protein
MALSNHLKELMGIKIYRGSLLPFREPDYYVSKFVSI